MQTMSCLSKNGPFGLYLIKKSHACYNNSKFEQRKQETTENEQEKEKQSLRTVLKIVFFLPKILNSRTCAN